MSTRQVESPIETSSACYWGYILTDRRHRVPVIAPLTTVKQPCQPIRFRRRQPTRLTQATPTRRNGSVRSGQATGAVDGCGNLPDGGARDSAHKVSASRHIADTAIMSANRPDFEIGWCFRGRRGRLYYLLGCVLPLCFVDVTVLGLGSYVFIALLVPSPCHSGMKRGMPQEVEVDMDDIMCKRGEEKTFNEPSIEGGTDPSRVSNVPIEPPNRRQHRTSYLMDGYT